MRTEENNLLVYWIEGTATSQDIEHLAKELDVDDLSKNISYLKTLKLKVKSEDESWESLKAKMQRKKEQVLV